MLSDVYSHFKIWDNYLFLDEDYSVPVQNCYQALCHNKEQAGTWTCSIDVDDIARVLLAYIQYFVTHPAREAANAGHPGSGVKYYYDEWSDRSDPYRKELVSKLAKMSEQHDSFVNDVLSYFYWAIKRGVVKSYILSPIGVSKFKDENWHRSGFWASTIDNIDSVFQFMADTLKSIGHIAVTAVNTGTGMIGKAIDAVGETFSTAAGFVSNLPYIVAGGVVLVAGFQVYHYNKRGKFYGEDTAKKLIEKKAGLGDGGEKSTDYTEVGEITPELAALINRPAGKIFITKAVINHIRNNHRKQIHRYTDKDILNYIINILCKINEIREGYDGALILAHRGKKTEDLVIVEECVLEFVDGAYIVKTAFRSKVKDLQNKKLIMCGKNAKKF